MVIVGFQMPFYEMEKLKTEACKRAGRSIGDNVQVYAFPSQLQSLLGIQMISYSETRWELPRLSYVVDSNQQKLILSRPTIAVVFSKTESKKYEYLVAGDVVTAGLHGWCRRRSSDNCVIWKGYWPDDNHILANWKTRFEPSGSRPTLYATRAIDLYKEQSTFKNQEAYMRFCRDEFGRGRDAQLDIGYYLES